MASNNRNLLLVIAVLLALNLGVQLLPQTPQGARQVLPVAQAQSQNSPNCPLPIQRRAFQGAALITASPGGDKLYVWDTDVVNGQVTASVSVFSATQR